ncbi:hypothetical protein SCHPADRAFT_886173 [Schizopora paradoxa]|uniref:Uncharacterized protein n=1 Tax=Schizopora paradoxa TaxID=27342 RepID=A0A0H2S9V3_9AGAM|nr:hypothetical protein SCHPADRAFT_886173 [Schizopora paradoxa]
MEDYLQSPQGQGQEMQVRLIEVQTTLTRLSTTFDRFARIYDQVIQRLNSAAIPQNIRYLNLELIQAIGEELQLLASVHDEVVALYSYENEMSSSSDQRYVRWYLQSFYNASGDVIVQHQDCWEKIKIRLLVVEMLTSAYFPEIH